MTDLVRAIDVELLKLRRTLALAVAVVVPCGTPGHDRRERSQSRQRCQLARQLAPERLIVDFGFPVVWWSIYAAKLITASLLLAELARPGWQALDSRVLKLSVLRPSLGLTPPIPLLDVSSHADTWARVFP